MKLKAIILSMLILCISSVSAYAAQLPRDMKDYLQSQKKVPSIRFDGIVIYNNDVMYLPVIPAYPEKVDTLKIVKTYPLNQSMDSLPDMVLFNNNYALLKIIKAGSNVLTVRNMTDIPSEILTGSLPQDIVVPRGLVFPENLAGILGDVQIPFVGSAKSQSFVSGRRSIPLPTGKRVDNTKKYQVPAALKNKLFFVNNFQTEYLQVFSSSVSEPLYSLKTSGVMKDVKSFQNGKYLIAATNRQKNLDIIDVADEYVVKHIDLTACPSEIVVDDANNLAYVASVDDESLFIIDLNSFAIKEKVQLVGSPQRMSLSKDGTMLAYVDIKTSDIYILDLKNDYENKLISNYPNATKLILDDGVVFVVARTAPKLRVIQFDLYQNNKTAKTKKDKLHDKDINDEEKSAPENLTEDIYTNFEYVAARQKESEQNGKEETVNYATSIKDVPVGVKPVDMVVYNGNLYVLCAGDNSVYTYNIAGGEVVSYKLPVDGFSKAFTIVPDSNLAVITNMGDLKYVVYDMAQGKAIQTMPVSEYINSINILERRNGN